MGTAFPSIQQGGMFHHYGSSPSNNFQSAFIDSQLITGCKFQALDLSSAVNGCISRTNFQQQSFHQLCQLFLHQIMSTSAKAIFQFIKATASYREKKRISDEMIATQQRLLQLAQTKPHFVQKELTSDSLFTKQGGEPSTHARKLREESTIGNTVKNQAHESSPQTLTLEASPNQSEQLVCSSPSTQNDVIINKKSVLVKKRVTILSPLTNSENRLQSRRPRLPSIGGPQSRAEAASTVLSNNTNGRTSISLPNSARGSLLSREGIRKIVEDKNPTSSGLREENQQLKNELESMQKKLESFEHALQVNQNKTHQMEENTILELQQKLQENTNHFIESTTRKTTEQFSLQFKAYFDQKDEELKLLRQEISLFTTKKEEKESNIADAATYHLLEEKVAREYHELMGKQQLLQQQITQLLLEREEKQQQQQQQQQQQRKEQGSFLSISPERPSSPPASERSPKVVTGTDITILKSIKVVHDEGADDLIYVFGESTQGPVSTSNRAKPKISQEIESEEVVEDSIYVFGESTQGPVADESLKTEATRAIFSPSSKKNNTFLPVKPRDDHHNEEVPETVYVLNESAQQPRSVEGSMTVGARPKVSFQENKNNDGKSLPKSIGLENPVYVLGESTQGHQTSQFKQNVSKDNVSPPSRESEASVYLFSEATQRPDADIAVLSSSRNEISSKQSTVVVSTAPKPPYTPKDLSGKNSLVARRLKVTPSPVPGASGELNLGSK